MNKLEMMKIQLQKANGMLSGLILKQPSVLYDYTIDYRNLSVEAQFYIGITKKIVEKGNEVVDEITFRTEVENLGLSQSYMEYGLSLIHI